MSEPRYLRDRDPGVSFDSLAEPPARSSFYGVSHIFPGSISLFTFLLSPAHLRVFSTHLIFYGLFFVFSKGLYVWLVPFWLACLHNFVFQILLFVRICRVNHDSSHVLVSLCSGQALGALLWASLAYLFLYTRSVFSILSVW
jgi:hypothetical protein